MNTENIKFDKDGDGIATLTWNMPGRSMNVLNAGSMADFRKLIETVVEDDSIKGVVITSAKPAFMAGADLDEMESGASGGGGSREERLRRQFEGVFGFNKLLRELEICGKPVAAAINGTALGGGLEVTLACHYRVVADNPKIQLGLPESKVGVMPGGGGTQRLPRLIGMAGALPLMLQGTSLDPEKALKSGIVHKAVPADQLISEAKRWIREEGDAEQPWDKKGFKVPGGGPYDDTNTFVIGNALLRKESYGNYPAQINIMRAVYEGVQVPMDAGLRIEARYFVDLLNRPESRNMIRTLFLSSQALAKGARRPGVPPTECKKIGILGAGLMGAGIAYVSAAAGIHVVLLDVSRENAEKGKSYSEKLLAKRVERGKTTEDRKADVLRLIQPTDSYDDLKGCDLIIEAVFEDRGIKAEVTKKTQTAVGADVIFGSNTSTLPITSLAEASGKPEHFIGIHFFSPVERMLLVEIIMGERTGDAAIAKAIDYVGRIRKTPIVVNDSRGFYTSRCFGTYVNEGLTMIAEGVNPALVENAGRMAGMPMGPMEVADSVGLDTAHKVRKQTKADLGDRAPDSPAGDLTAWMVETHNRVGRKAGQGFYDYGEDGKPVRIWPAVYNYARQKPHDQPGVEEVKRRLLYIQALETARCFEEGVLEDVRDADVGSIFGWGFAPYTGGTLSFIDTVGLARFVEECERMAGQYGDRFTPNALLKDMAAKGETFYGRFNPKARAA